MVGTVELGPGLRRDDVKKTGGRPQTRATEAVRAYASRTVRISRRGTRMDLGLSAQEVDTAFDTLIRTGRIKRTGKGIYQWCEKRKGKEAPLEARIWHAMRINSPSWSASDIAQQAGTTTSYVYKRLRVYRAEGFIQRAGIKRVPGGAVRLWRLTSTAAKMIELPRVEEYSPDPLAVAAVRLNRLICTGLVRFVDERREAINLCNEIVNRSGQSHGEGP